VEGNVFHLRRLDASMLMRVIGITEDEHS